jgi:hypothetical protein
MTSPNLRGRFTMRLVLIVAGVFAVAALYLFALGVL